jgi:phosphohistidine phosphatase SixA
MPIWRRKATSNDVPTPPPERQKVWALRHGDHREDELTEQGKQQAHEAALFLEVDIPLDEAPIRVLCSPKKRCVQTAEIICKLFDAKPEPVEWLNIAHRYEARGCIAQFVRETPGIHLVVVTHEDVMVRIVDSVVSDFGNAQVLHLHA